MQKSKESCKFFSVFSFLNVLWNASSLYATSTVSIATTPRIFGRSTDHGDCESKWDGFGAAVFHYFIRLFSAFCRITSKLRLLSHRLSRLSATHLLIVSMVTLIRLSQWLNSLKCNIVDSAPSWASLLHPSCSQCCRLEGGSSCHVHGALWCPRSLAGVSFFGCLWFFFKLTSAVGTFRTWACGAKQQNKMVHGSWLKTQGSWIKARGSRLMAHGQEEI